MNNKSFNEKSDGNAQKTKDFSIMCPIRYFRGEKRRKHWKIWG